MANPPARAAPAESPSQPLSAITAAWIFSAASIFCLSLRLGRLHHDRAHDAAARGSDPIRAARRGDENEARRSSSARAAASIATAPPSLCPATAMRRGSTSGRFGEPFDGGDQVVGVVLERDPLAAAAALADAALVVAENHESLVRQRSPRAAQRSGCRRRPRRARPGPSPRPGRSRDFAAGRRPPASSACRRG